MGFRLLFTESPVSYKRCLVYILVNRYFKICSSYQLFHSELLNNGYPDTFLDSCIRVFLDKLFSPPTRNSNTPDKTVLNFSLPFTGSHSLQIRTQIAKLCSSAFPCYRTFHLPVRQTTVRFLFLQRLNSQADEVAYYL